MGSSEYSLKKHLTRHVGPLRLTNKNRPREWAGGSYEHRWRDEAEEAARTTSALPRHKEEARQKQITRFRLFILLTYTAARVATNTAIQRALTTTTNRKPVFLLVREMMVTNP